MIRELVLNQSNRAIDGIYRWSKSGDLLLDPPYQRGDVWGNKRRVNLIRSLLQGVPIPSIVINERLFADWKDDSRIAVIDGKQRITAILKFLNGELAVPGEWFGVYPESVYFCDLTRSHQRKFFNRPIAVTVGRLPDEATEKVVFDLINFGGLAQGESDYE